LPILLVTAALILALDLATKAVATRTLAFGEPREVLGEFVRFTLVHNTGAAFGLFPGSRFAFILFSTAAMGVILALYFRLPGRSRVQLAAMGALLVGALGNLHDRIRHGYVVDFIEIGVGRYHWPVFNVADMAVTGGVALLLWGVARRSP
jgi:signal peptidase II